MFSSHVSKNVNSLTQGPNWPPLIQKRYVTHAGPNRPFRCLDDCKNVAKWWGLRYQMDFTVCIPQGRQDLLQGRKLFQSWRTRERRGRKRRGEEGGQNSELQKLVNILTNWFRLVRKQQQNEVSKVPLQKKIIFTVIALLIPILSQSSHNTIQGSAGWALQGPRDPSEEA